MKRVVSVFMIGFLLAGLLLLRLDISVVGVAGVIYIMEDGSVVPEGTPISTTDNVTYAFTNSISCDSDGIVVKRSNITIDGRGYTLQGSGEDFTEGFHLAYVNNVTIKNTNISDFSDCVYADRSYCNKVCGNNMTGADWGSRGVRLYYCAENHICENNILLGGGGVYIDHGSNNCVTENNIVGSQVCGVDVSSSSNNTVSFNEIRSMHNIGICLEIDSNNNTVLGNTVEDTPIGMQFFTQSNGNKVYHNNFITTLLGVAEENCSNIWDNDCEGNYWSDYEGTDADDDGIGDTPYVIDEDDIDHYPLMNVYWNPADVDHDLDVDVYDAVRLLVAYSSKEANENYDPHVDIAEPHGQIDLFDAVLVLVNYGKKYP